MGAQQAGKGRANALKAPLTVRIEEPCKAPAEVVYGLVADLRRHMEWAGEMQPKKNFRLASMEAPEGEATVGTEFRTVGADPSGRFTDASVVTEAIRPREFEFVTEAHLDTKKGRGVDWTNVHRYEVVPDGEGSRIAYALRVERISDLPGSMAALKVPGLRGMAGKISASYMRRGLKNLVKLAEQRASA
ncbi:MAG TPA: SRPBCC family protein [Actinomycetota bacterium]|nr:SRPBCC family protein [Actinomycetota bacterium]